MARKYFGTDGGRGRANQYPMTAEIALRIGAAAGQYFRNDDNKVHRVVSGKDTRLSGYMFENALTAGLTSAGMNVLLLGPVPTPAVGLLTPSMRADLGIMISASHNRGLKQLRESIAEQLTALDLLEGTEWEEEADGIRVAVVGRPNVGKSTLVNRLIGEDRQVVFDMPGTTKDAIDIPFHKDGTDYVLIDTAGVRRKGKVSEVTEKFSVVKALQAMERAHVVILVIDASEGLVEQDLHVLDYALEAGAGMVIAVNKWDGLEQAQRDKVKKALDRRLNFVPWVPLATISALHGSGVGKLLGRVEQVYKVGLFDVSTSLLTRLVRNMTAAHPTPSVRGRAIKIKVATRAGSHPPRIVVHGNQLGSLPASYRRFLENGFREALNLVGNPVKLELRDSDNPFAGKRNVLTQRQVDRRKRSIKHRKKSKNKK